jgi:hypothetical protein
MSENQNNSEKKSRSAKFKNRLIIVGVVCGAIAGVYEVLNIFHVGERIDDWIKDKVVTIVEDREEVLASKGARKISFRALIAKGRKIEVEQVPYELVEFWDNQEKFRKQVEELLPILISESEVIIPRLIIYSDGTAGWIHTNGKEYDASRRSDGHYYFLYNGELLRCEI